MSRYDRNHNVNILTLSIIFPLKLRTCVNLNLILLIYIILFIYFFNFNLLVLLMKKELKVRKKIKELPDLLLYLNFDVKQTASNNRAAVNSGTNRSKERNRDYNTRMFPTTVLVLSLNRVSLLSFLLMGHVGFASTNGKGRCAVCPRWNGRGHHRFKG